MIKGKERGRGGEGEGERKRKEMINITAVQSEIKRDEETYIRDNRAGSML